MKFHRLNSERKHLRAPAHELWVGEKPATEGAAPLVAGITAGAVMFIVSAISRGPRAAAEAITNPAMAATLVVMALVIACLTRWKAGKVGIWALGVAGGYAVASVATALLRGGLW